PVSSPPTEITWSPRSTLPALGRRSSGLAQKPRRIDAVMKFVSLLGLLAALAASRSRDALGADALAEDACPGQKVQVTLVVILASEEGNKVEPKLKAIADEIRLMNPNLKSFYIKSMTTKSLAAEDKTLFPLVDNKHVAITIKQAADQEKRIGLA